MERKCFGLKENSNYYFFEYSGIFLFEFFSVSNWFRLKAKTISRISCRVHFHFFPKTFGFIFTINQRLWILLGDFRDVGNFYGILNEWQLDWQMLKVNVISTSFRFSNNGDSIFIPNVGQHLTKKTLLIFFRNHKNHI